MLRKVFDTSAHPRRLLRSVLALDDSPHAVALGVAIGIFVGLTPTVGIQTALILGLVVACRKVCYFNGAAAMASTYVSNPFTMVPMYYFWYRVGVRWFFPGSDANVNLDAITEFNGMAGWWAAMCDLGVRVGAPMFAGALATAPFGAIVAYATTYFALKRIHRHDDDDIDQQPPSDVSSTTSSPHGRSRVDNGSQKITTPRTIDRLSEINTAESLTSSF